MGVVETRAIRRKDESGAEAFRKAIRKHATLFNVENLESRAIGTALPNRVCQEATILRDRSYGDGSRVPAPTLGWIDQNSLRPEQPVPHDDDRLHQVFLKV